MLRLKKKKAEEEKQVQDELILKEKNEISNETSELSQTLSTEEKSSDEGIKLLGIGGKSITPLDGTKKLGKKKTPGEIRIQKDIADLDGGNVTQIIFPNPNDLTSFNVIVKPDSGPWSGASYQFTFTIPGLYPHEPPKVVCNTKIYHPNIDLAGAVCLNILREDWKPVLDINAVIYGLIYLFYEPNPDDPLNREAADLYRRDKAEFNRLVKKTLMGYSYSGVYFPRLI